MSINFEFLNEIKDDDYLRICKKLYAACSNVEEFTYTKPDVALGETRKAGELMAKLYYTKRVGNCGKISFNALLGNDTFRDSLYKLPQEKGYTIRDDFYQIKDEGNPSVHGQDVSNAVTRALTNLEKLHRIVTALLADLNLLDISSINPYSEPPVPPIQPHYYTMQAPMKTLEPPAQAPTAPEQFSKPPAAESSKAQWSGKTAIRPDPCLKETDILQKKNSGGADRLSLDEKPVEICAPNFHCFDSNVSRLHYFIAGRNDYYATNALEYLDYHAFLYILLKEQGYQRIIIVGTLSEDGSNCYPVIAYDSLSQLGDAGSPFHSVQDKASLFGKRVIGRIFPASGNQSAPNESFESFITVQLNAAFKSDLLKTAVVMPLELLLEHGCLSNAAVHSLRTNIRNPGSNILVITAEQQEDLLRLFDSRVSQAYQKVDDAVKATIAKFRGPQETAVYGSAFVEELSLNRRILVATSTPGPDEIANLLLALKMRRPKEFAGLAYSKIYALTEFISTRCRTTADTQNALRELKNNTWYVGPLRNLELALRDGSVRAALAKVADSLWPRTVCPAIRMQSTYIERIYAGANWSSQQYSQAPVTRGQISGAELESESGAVCQEFDHLIGLSSVTNDLLGKISVKASAANMFNDKGPGHYIFSGNPGTGKTTIAERMGILLHSKRLLTKGHVVKVSRDDLVSNYPGGSEAKTRKKCEAALDGVLFIDGVYQLVNMDENKAGSFSSTFDEEAYMTLLAFMKHNKERLCVVCTGRPYEMERFRSANSDMTRQIPEENMIYFPDFAPEDLYGIMLASAKAKGFTLLESFGRAAQDALRQMYENRDKNFANADDVHSFLDACKENALRRNVLKPELTAEDIPLEFKQSLNMEKLDELVGLERVKKQLQGLLAQKFIAMGAKRGPGNYIFAGSPGTGKAATARAVSRVLKGCGLLKRGHIVEVSRDSLAADSEAQMAGNALKQCTKALDGVLFISQAGQLSGTGAIEAIIKFIRDNAQRICVIFAGLESEMDTFKTDSRLRDYVAEPVIFEAYTDDELIEILKSKAKPMAELSEDFLKLTREMLPAMRRSEAFRGAKTIARYLELCIAAALLRRYGSDLHKISDIVTLLPEDIPEQYIYSDAGGNPQETPENVRREMLPIRYRLLPKSVIANLPNPYEDLKLENTPGLSSRFAQSVFRIKTEFGYGTAFVISPDGYAITCAHVIAQKNNLANLAKELDAYSKAGQALKFEIVNTRPDLDMALIQLEVERPLPYLKLADETRQPQMGDECLLQGYPDGREGILQFPASISGESEKGKNGELGEIYHINVYRDKGNAESGDSGGPLIAKSDNCVIGILRGADDKYDYMKPTFYFWKEFLK